MEFKIPVKTVSEVTTAASEDEDILEHGGFVVLHSSNTDVVNVDLKPELGVKNWSEDHYGSFSSNLNNSVLSTKTLNNWQALTSPW